MLLLLFRGIFLIGILSWYSTNVWKMIDGYFKDRFEQYLQREYEKNPKMRDDVDAYGTSLKGEKRTSRGQSAADRRTEIDDRIKPEQRSCVTVATLDEETCSIDFATVEAAAGAAATGSGSSSPSSNNGDTIGSGRPSESEVVGKGAIDKNAFAKSSSSAGRAMKSAAELPARTDEGKFLVDSDEVAKSALTAEAIIVSAEENVTSNATRNSGASSDATTKPSAVGAETGDAGKNVARKPTKRKSTQRRSSRESLKARIATEQQEDAKNKEKKKKKQKVKTIVLTEEDFKQAKIRAGLQDYDFSEFDDDEAADEPPEGILVSELPFKPRADIGNLERVTDDEFCPLTLEDEVNCGETKTWP